jgi:hypothetical protein
VPIWEWPSSCAGHSLRAAELPGRLPKPKNVVQAMRDVDVDVRALCCVKYGAFDRQRRNWRPGAQRTTGSCAGRATAEGSASLRGSQRSVGAN